MPFDQNITQFPNQGFIGKYQFIGEEFWNAPTLKMLAEGFMQIQPTDFDFLFPPKMAFEQVLKVEQKIETYEIMPAVRQDEPNGMYLQPNRRQQFIVSPQTFRENDYVSQTFINRNFDENQIRLSMQSIVQDRMKEFIARHSRTRSIFQAKVLLGGWTYLDARTQTSVNVQSNIPAHNQYRFDGWTESVNAGDTLTFSSESTWVAAQDLVPIGKPDAGYFQSTDGKLGVPWTNRRADIVKGLRLLLNEFAITNKNRATHILMHEALLNHISAVNVVLASYQGHPGAFILNQPNNTDGVAGNANFVAPYLGVNPKDITFGGPGGNINTICGLQVVPVNGYWKNPETATQEIYWPPHQVVIVAAKGATDPSATLGYTYYSYSEALEPNPGLWVRTYESTGEYNTQPGWYMTIGDCFMPFPVYPHWIAILDVCDPRVLYDEVPTLKNFTFGWF